jgi:uncharacterized protein (TIGR00725 family)
VAQQRSTPARFAQATIIGDADAAPDTLALAGQVGAMLASHSITIITGGRGGVMEAATRAAAQLGGTTIGILPSTQMDDANPWCSIVIPTGLGHARNVVTALAADMIIAVGGGAGTLSELCFAWIHGRSIYLMEGSGGWSDRLAGNTLDHRAKPAIVHCNSLAALESHVVEFCQTRGIRFREA